MGFFDWLPCCGAKEQDEQDSNSVTESATLLPPPREASIISVEGGYGATESMNHNATLTSEQKQRIEEIGRQTGSFRVQREYLTRNRHMLSIHSSRLPTSPRQGHSSLSRDRDQDAASHAHRPDGSGAHGHGAIDRSVSASTSASSSRPPSPSPLRPETSPPGGMMRGGSGGGGSGSAREKDTARGDGDGEEVVRKTLFGGDMRGSSGRGRGRGRGRGKAR